MSAIIAFVLTNWRWLVPAAGAALLLAMLGVARIELASVRAEYANHLAADAKAIADAKTAQRNAERASTVVQAAIETDFLKETRNATASADRTIADLRSGALQLRPSLTCSGAGVPGPSASTGKRDAASTGGLRQEDIEFLLREAKRADQLALQLHAAQEVITADRRATGVQGSP